MGIPANIFIRGFYNDVRLREGQKENIYRMSQDKMIKGMSVILDVVVETQ